MRLPTLATPYTTGRGYIAEWLMRCIEGLRSVVARAWNPPASLPQAIQLEWRFVAIRWAGILFVAPGLPFVGLSTQRLLAAYGVLIGAAVYNLALQVMLRRRPALFANGYVTTICDALLNVGMITVGGGFDTPFYFILFTVTISAAMRYGYTAAIGMVLVFVTFDVLENLILLEGMDISFVLRSGFLLITAVLAGYLREQAQSAESALNERLHQANALNKELASFSYSVSHDLRAPLRSIDGFCQALLEDYGEQLDAEGQEYLRRTRAASQRMAQLIDDLLMLSRLSRREMRHEKVDLAALAQEVFEECRAREPERAIEFVVPGKVMAWGDAALLRVVLENLIGNAWKFTSRHPTARIEFGMSQRDGHPVYFVRDDGAGFDPTYASKLFGAFQRLHSPSEFEGTGIGLATVQRIIHRHGGHVWAEGAIERGATFFFTLGDHEGGG